MTGVTPCPTAGPDLSGVSSVSLASPSSPHLALSSLHYMAVHDSPPQSPRAVLPTDFGNSHSSSGSTIADPDIEQDGKEKMSFASSPTRLEEPDPRNSLQHVLSASSAARQEGLSAAEKATPSTTGRTGVPESNRDVTEDEGDDGTADAHRAGTRTPSGAGGALHIAPHTTSSRRNGANNAASSIYTGNKIPHLKREDGIPLWRKDIQYEFLRGVFEDQTHVFTNSYDNSTQNTFADIYVDAMARSSKTSKILRDKLMSDRPAALNMAMVCLLVNVGRMNTTLNFFPEMRAQLRTYHSIPSLQAHQDPNAYKQLQDAPRLKSILKGATEDRPGEPNTPEKIKQRAIPRTNPVNLIFVLSQYAPQISERHFTPPRDFFDLIMRDTLSSASRARGFLWLMWWYLESDFSEKDALNNPFGPGQAAEDGGIPQKLPAFEHLTQEKAELENVDTQEELDFGEEKRLERKRILETDLSVLPPKVKRGKHQGKTDFTTIIMPIIVRDHISELNIKALGTVTRRAAFLTPEPEFLPGTLSTPEVKWPPKFSKKPGHVPIPRVYRSPQTRRAPGRYPIQELIRTPDFVLDNAPGGFSFTLNSLPMPSLAPSEDGAASPARDGLSPHPARSMRNATRSRGRKSSTMEAYNYDTDGTRSASPGLHQSFDTSSARGGHRLSASEMRINSVLNDDPTASTPPYARTGRGRWPRKEVIEKGGPQRIILKTKMQQIPDSSSPAPPGAGHPVLHSNPDRRQRPLTAHQMAVERNRQQRVEYLLDRKKRKMFERRRKKRESEGAIWRALKRCEAMEDPFANSEEEGIKGPFKDRGFGGLMALNYEEEDFGEEVGAFAAALRRARRRLDRWEEEGKMNGKLPELKMSNGIVGDAEEEEEYEDYEMTEAMAVKAEVEAEEMEEDEQADEMDREVVGENEQVDEEEEAEEYDEEDEMDVN